MFKSLPWDNQIFRFTLFVSLLVVSFLIGRQFNLDVEHYRQLLTRFPIVVSGIVFVSVYVGITFFVWFGTIDLFRITASLLFGAYWGTLFVWIAEMINACVLFRLSRALGREYVVEKFKLDQSKVNEVKKDVSFLNVFTLRLNPLIPFRFMDLGFGLSSISFKTYWQAILISSLIRVFWLQWILAAVGASIFKDMPFVQEYLKTHPKFIVFSLVYFFVVFILTIAMIWVRKFRKVV